MVTTILVKIRWQHFWVNINWRSMYYLDTSTNCIPSKPTGHAWRYRLLIGYTSIPIFYSTIYGLDVFYTVRKLGFSVFWYSLLKACPFFNSFYLINRFSFNVLQFDSNTYACAILSNNASRTTSCSFSHCTLSQYKITCKSHHQLMFMNA